MLLENLRVGQLKRKFSSLIKTAETIEIVTL